MRSVVDRNVSMGRMNVVLIRVSLKTSENVACVGGGGFTDFPFLFGRFLVRSQMTLLVLEGFFCHV